MRSTGGRFGSRFDARSLRRWAAVVPLMPLVLGLGGASPSVAEDLRVGISKSYPPLAFLQDGKPAGVDVDLARLVGARLHRRIVFVALGFPELIPALEAGRVDVVMSGLSVTEDRQQKVQFLDSYLRVGQMALIRADDLARAANPDAMGAQGSRVGVKRGTTGEGWARQNLPEATVVSFDTIEQGTAALREEQIDYFVHDAPTIWRLTGRGDTRDEALAGIYRPLTKEYLAWAVRADDTKLAAELNGVLADLRGDGELRKVLDRWIPVTKVAVPGDEPRPTAAPATSP